MSDVTNPFIKQIKPLLDETGLPWRAVHGKRHIKIMVGPVMMMVVSRGSGTSDPRQIKNTKCIISRFVRENKYVRSDVV